MSFECSENKYVTFEIIGSNSDIKIKKNKPEIDLKIKAKGNLTSVMCNYDISKDSGIKQIEKQGSEEIKRNIVNLIDLSKEYNSDIFYFRNLYYKKNNGYYKKITDYDSFYNNLKINVDVYLDIFEKGNSLQVIENEKNK